MRRFYVPPELSRGDTFELPEREARHAAQVIRLQPGDELTVLDGAGGVLTCEAISVSKRSVHVNVRQRIIRPALPCAVTLVQAIPKGPAFETIVQKATELGATRLVPLLSERVIVHLDPRDAESKVEKWRQIAIESVKQCGSPWLPIIEPPIQMPAALTAVARNELQLVASLERGSQSLRNIVATHCACQGASPKTVSVWIGPEGDFTTAEYAALRGAGAQAVSLGSLVLRADTAAIAMLAMVNHELQAT